MKQYLIYFVQFDKILYFKYPISKIIVILD